MNYLYEEKYNPRIIILVTTGKLSELIRFSVTLFNLHAQHVTMQIRTKFNVRYLCGFKYSQSIIGHKEIICIVFWSIKKKFKWIFANRTKITLFNWLALFFVKLRLNSDVWDMLIESAVILTCQAVEVDYWHWNLGSDKGAFRKTSYHFCLDITGPTSATVTSVKIPF